MVATQAATGAVLAVVASKTVPRLPPVAKDAQTDAAIKAALGIGLVIAATWVKNGWAKTALVGAGVGIAAGAAAPFIPALR
jgi:hypothetical protein